MVWCGVRWHGATRRHGATRGRRETGRVDVLRCRYGAAGPLIVGGRNPARQWCRRSSFRLWRCGSCGFGVGTLSLWVLLRGDIRPGSAAFSRSVAFGRRSDLRGPSDLRRPSHLRRSTNLRSGSGIPRSDGCAQRIAAGWGRRARQPRRNVWCSVVVGRHGTSSQCRSSAMTLQRGGRRCGIASLKSR